MDYVYRIPAKPAAVVKVGSLNNVEVPVYVPQFAFKPYYHWNSDRVNYRMFSRLVGPTERAWERRGGFPRDGKALLIVSEIAEGEGVYLSNLVNPYYNDESQERDVRHTQVGELFWDGKGWLIRDVSYDLIEEKAYGFADKNSA
jgi:hypothetical protein